MGKNQIPFRMPERFERYRHLIYGVPEGSTVEDVMNTEAGVASGSKLEFQLRKNMVEAQVTFLYRLEEDGMLKK